MYKHEQTAINAALADRIYGDFELALSDPNAVCDITEGNTNPGSVDNLTIRRGTLRFSTGNGLPQLLSIRNDLKVLPEGSFDYSPASSPALSTLHLNGTSRQLIGGTLVIGAQAELEIDNASGVELQQNLEVNGRLQITRGLLQTQTYLVTMGATATLSESETARVIGQIRTTRTLSQGVNHDFGGLGLEILAAGASPGGTTVNRVTGPAAIRPIQDGTPSIQRYFSILPSNNAALNARLTFRYFDAELTGEEGGLVLFRILRQGTDWINEQGELNAAVNTLTRTEITSLGGEWTAASDNALLPVRLISFNGRREGPNVRLYWKTASETNNAGFEVQRSADLQEFVSLGFVNASAATDVPNFYTFVDENHPQASYYRLKQLDHNGDFMYTKAIFVRASSLPGFESLVVYPNPTAGKIHLSLPEKGEKIQVTLFSLQGARLVQFTVFPQEAEACLSGAMGQVAAGLYLLHIHQGAYRYQIRLEKH